MKSKTVAAFDFDGTISTRDVQMPFALFVIGFKKWIGAVVCLIPSAFLFCARQTTRQELKEKALTLFFGGLPYSRLESSGKEFAEEIIPKLLKPKSIEAIEWHRKQGHRVVIVSASPEVYLIPWAKIMGIDNVLASKLELDSENRVTGKLLGLNCRGAEKVRRLKELLGEEKDYDLYAYGDSPGDRELLDYADHRFYRKF